MQMSDWNLIRTLYSCRNLTRAAELLYLSQPTVTKRLQAIEKEFGVTIAERGKRGIIFTPEGEYLAVKAAQMLNLMQEIEEHLAAGKQEPECTFMIGASNSISRFVLPGLMQRFQSSHPHIRFEITTGMSSQISHLVEQRKLDLGFVNGDFTFIGAKDLFRVEQGYLASSVPIPLSKLPDQPYITYFKDSNTQCLIEQWWREHFSIPFPQGLTVKDGDICKSMITRGLGYSFFFTREYLDQNPECIYPLSHADGRPLTRNTWILSLKENAGRREVSDFLTLALASQHHE